MNAVEIADAVAELAGQPFDQQEFPYAFLRPTRRKTSASTRRPASFHVEIKGLVTPASPIRLGGRRLAGQQGVCETLPWDRLRR